MMRLTRQFKENCYITESSPYFSSSKIYSRTIQGHFHLKWFIFYRPVINPYQKPLLENNPLQPHRNCVIPSAQDAKVNIIIAHPSVSPESNRLNSCPTGLWGRSSGRTGPPSGPNRMSFSPEDERHPLPFFYNRFDACDTYSFVKLITCNIYVFTY